MAEPAAKRETKGLVLRGVVAELERRGLTERVLGHLQGAARDALVSPPFHTTWAPTALFDELLLAIARETDRQTVREIGYSVMKSTTGPILRPMLRTVLALSGATALTLLNNLNRMSALLMRGIQFAWVEEAPRSAVVTITCSEPVDPVHFAAWEGVFAFAQDILGIPIHVDQAVPLPDGCSARVRIGW